MKGSIFQHEVSKTSSVFGRKSDVQVVFQGDQAATDGSTIIIPAINTQADVTDEQAAIIRGYVDHESGHVRYSDIDALTQAGREAQAEGNALRPALINALEDVWLERKVRQEYPGAERNLRATVTAVNREFLSQVEKGDPRLSQDEFVTPVALTWEGRKGYGGETCEECLDLLDDGLRKALGKWIAAIDGCESSRDIITLAREVERQLSTGEHREENPRGSSDDTGRERSEGDDDEHREDGSLVEDDDGNPERARGNPQEHDSDYPDDSGDEPGDEPGDDGDDSPVEDAPGGGVGASERDFDGEIKPYDPDMTSVIEKVAEETEGGYSPDSYRPGSTAHDKWHHRLDSKGKYVSYNGHDDSLGPKLLTWGTAHDYSRVLEDTAGVTNVMRRKLERSLMAKQQRDWDTGHEHGRLDSRRLAAAYAGKENVFKIRDDRSEMDTALSILVDLSGSMCGYPVRLAQQTVIAMVEAIDRTGIAYEVLGFNNRTRWLEGVALPSYVNSSGHGFALENMSNYDRLEPLDMYVFKDYAERLREAKGALASIEQCSGGNNSDGCAVELAYNRLRQRPERRKILMVFSDGLPAAANGRDQERENYHLRNVVAGIEADGVDVMGIGIDSDAVERFYPQYVVVNNLDDLAGGALDLMARALMGERYQVDNSKLLSAAS